MWCFVHFDFQVCFAPQRRALFRHLNFQKWSERQVFLVFSLANVLRASSRHNGVHFFDISTSKSDPRMVCFVHSSRHNGVQLFISHLARWLRTRRFSEPTFRPSSATNHWKNTVFCDFPTFSRICIFFLLTLSLLWSPLFYSSLLSDSSHLCFSSVHIVGSLTSKLPSIIPIIIYTSSTAQGGGGSFKNRKPIGEVGCCESGMAERIHWWTERSLRSPLFRSLSLTIYLPTYLSSMYLSIYRSIYLSLSFICLSVYLSICLPVYLWCSVIQRNVV